MSARSPARSCGPAGALHAGGIREATKTGAGTRRPPPDSFLLLIVAVALLVVGIGASLGGPTGYAINPARDLGPRVAHAVLPIKGKGGSDWGYSWVPIVGPMIGAVLASVTYLIFW